MPRNPNTSQAQTPPPAVQPITDIDAEIKAQQLEAAKAQAEAAKLHLEMMQANQAKMAQPVAAPLDAVVVNPYAPRRINELREMETSLRLVENDSMGSTYLETKARHVPTGWDYGWAVNPQAMRRKAGTPMQVTGDYSSMMEFINNGYRAVDIRDVTPDLEFAQQNDIFCLPNVTAGPGNAACYMDLMLMARPQQLTEQHLDSMHRKTKEEIKRVTQDWIGKADVPQRIKDAVLEEADKHAPGLKQITGNSGENLKQLRFVHEFDTNR